MFKNKTQILEVISKLQKAREENCAVATKYKDRDPIYTSRMAASILEGDLAKILLEVFT